MNEEDIKQIKLNIFYGSQESIDYYNFPWHKLENKIQATKVNSSQALAIDLFGMIKCSNFKNIIIGDIFNTNKNLDWKIEFEWKDKKLLNEKIATQIDLKISSEEYIFLIEFKFTENQEGTCSQVNKITSGKNKGLIQCDGNYKLQTNPVNNIKEKCSLTGKNIDYWKLIPEIFDLKQENDYLPCPFKGNYYQIMRNLCLAKSLEKKLGTKTKCFLIYFDNDRLPISKKINSKCFIIQDDIIPNLERENLSEKIIESLKPLLKNNLKQKDFEKELTLLNLTDEQKELINKYTFESYRYFHDLNLLNLDGEFKIISIQEIIKRAIKITEVNYENKLWKDLDKWINQKFEKLI